jgi:E3 ubiquitin-protein ligase MARCH6
LVGRSVTYPNEDDGDVESYDQYFVEVPEYGSDKEESDETASEGDVITIDSDDAEKSRHWQANVFGERDNKEQGEDEDEDDEDDEDEDEDDEDDDQGEDGIFDEPWDVIEDGDNEAVDARPQPREGAGQGAAGDGQARQDENPAAVAAELNEEMEGNVEDDMEGALEGKKIFESIERCIKSTFLAIGMRGPVYGVIQNVGL